MFSWLIYRLFDRLAEGVEIAIVIIVGVGRNHQYFFALSTSLALDSCHAGLQTVYRPTQLPP